MTYRKAGRGALIILALLLASSGSLRIGADIGAAMALSTEQESVLEKAPQQCGPMPSALALALSEREEKMTIREAAIRERLAALALAEDIAAKRLAELESAEAKLRETLAIADSAAEEDLLRLTAVYETMKPKDAAGLFQAMAPEFAAGFLGRMKPEAAGAILSGMSAETAYGISVILAGRNTNAPKN